MSTVLGTGVGGRMGTVLPLNCPLWEMDHTQASEALASECACIQLHRMLSLFSVPTSVVLPLSDRCHMLPVCDPWTRDPWAAS